MMTRACPRRAAPTRHRPQRPPKWTHATPMAAPRATAVHFHPSWCPAGHDNCWDWGWLEIVNRAPCPAAGQRPGQPWRRRTIGHARTARAAGAAHGPSADRQPPEYACGPSCARVLQADRSGALAQRPRRPDTQVSPGLRSCASKRRRAPPLPYRPDHTLPSARGAGTDADRGDAPLHPVRDQDHRASGPRLRRTAPDEPDRPGAAPSGLLVAGDGTSGLRRKLRGHRGFPRGQCRIATREAPVQGGSGLAA
jgi:hypothetical protein